MPTLVRAFCTFVVLLLLPLPVAADASTTDVRLIVDISGSMRQNDPHNLRRPAVRLVTELLRDQTLAGIWTFGEYTNMLVPHGPVDERWRALALKSISQINSVALRTHIGRALEVASDDFYTDQRRDNTHFILLTDGMVDIAPASLADAVQRNRAERERILAEVVPEIAAKGAHIHAIALSPNADLALLKQIARATNGSFAVAESDQSLSLVFLKALERAAPSEEVPLRGSRFTIDPSISEFTAVIFHNVAEGTEEGAEQGADESALGLRSPSGQTMLKDAPDAALAETGKPEVDLTSASRNGPVRWVSGDDYALVTVENPEGGEWEILGDLGNGSRVKIVSDLQMSVSQLPGFFFAGEQLPLNIGFTSEGEPVVDPEFLQFLTVEVQLQTSDGRSGAKTLSDPNRIPEDGIYRDTISRLKVPGEYVFTVVADGKTFQRQSRQTIRLRAPVEVTVEGQGAGGESQYLIQARVTQPGLDPAQTRVIARVIESDAGPGSGKQVRELTLDPATGVWSFKLTPAQGEGDFTATVELQGISATGEAVSHISTPIGFSLPRPSASPSYLSEQPGDLSKSVAVAEMPDPPPASAAPATLQANLQSQIGADAALPEIQAGPGNPDTSEDLALAADAPNSPVTTLDPPADDTDESAPSDVSSGAEGTETPATGDQGGAWPWALGGGLGLLMLGSVGFWFYRRRTLEAAVAPLEETAQEAESLEPALDGEGEETTEPEPIQEGSADDDFDADALVDQALNDAAVPEPSEELSGEELPEEELSGEELPEDDDEFSLEDFDLSESDPPSAGPDDGPAEPDPKDSRQPGIDKSDTDKPGQ